MSLKTHRSTPARRRSQARVFSALGDTLRLELVTKLGSGRPHSIAELTKGSRVTRQAITKHLRVLEDAGIVHCVPAGREKRFEFDPQPMEEIKQYLDLISEQWDETLARLKSFVED